MAEQQTKADCIRVWGFISRRLIDIDAGEVACMLSIWGHQRPVPDCLSTTIYDLMSAGF